MAVPRKRKSNARRKSQRAHDALALPNLQRCPNCEAPKAAHRACPSCGQYAGRAVAPTAAD